jgi:putative hydrolase of the HAD superfamily
VEINFSKIKNIILDLGNVIINIDFELTYKALASLTQRDIFEVKKELDDTNLWNRYEEGLISDELFLKTLYDALELTCTQKELEKAWCGLLLDIPQRRIDLIDELRKKYRVFILSNTSDIHIQVINGMIKNQFGRPDLESLVEKAYYSYQMKMRKPGKEIYQTMLSDAKILASETLFLDDNEDNIEGAKKCGIQTVLVDPNNSCMTEYLKNA